MKPKNARVVAVLVLAVSGAVAAACGSDPASIQSSGDGADGGTGANTNDGATSTSDGAPKGNPNDAGKSPSGSNSDGGEGGASSSTNDYTQDGSHTVSTKNESVADAGADTFTVITYVPSGAGPFPVVVLTSGLEQTAAAYAPYAQRLASWGIAAILRDDPGFTTSATTLQADVESLVTLWLPTADANAFDVTRVGLAGHSRGGEVSLLAAENGLLGKNKGLFLLDPVDAASGTEARTKVASLGVPLDMIGETTDSTGGIGGQACAPVDDNYEMFYAAASSPALAITAVNADHTMFEDAANCTFCTLCTAGTASQPLVLATSVSLMTTFFAKVLLNDTSVDATLNSAALVTAGTITVESK